jgi:hypothetical protein
MGTMINQGEIGFSLNPPEGGYRFSQASSLTILSGSERLKQ